MLKCQYQKALPFLLQAAEQKYPPAYHSFRQILWK